MVPSFKATPFLYSQETKTILSLTSTFNCLQVGARLCETPGIPKKGAGGNLEQSIHGLFIVDLIWVSVVSAQQPAHSFQHGRASLSIAVPALLLYYLVFRLGQGLANSGWRAKSSHMDAHSHSHIHPFTDHRRLLLCYNGRDEYLWQRQYDLQTLRCLLTDPLQKKIADPLSRESLLVPRKFFNRPPLQLRIRFRS